MTKSLLCWLGAALALGPAYALEIKGVHVDKPADCEFIRSMELRSGTFHKTCELRGPQWMTQVSFLEGRATLWVQQSDQGIIQMVSVMDFDFDGALTAFTAKFGQPTIERSVVQNAMGAKFDQVEAVWTEGEQQLRLSKHGPRLNRPVLVLSGAEFKKAKPAKPSGNI